MYTLDSDNREDQVSADAIRVETFPDATVWQTHSHLWPVQTHRSLQLIASGQS